MRMNHSVMVGCAALTAFVACANRPDTSLEEATTAEARKGNHGDVGVTVANYMIARWPNLPLEDGTCTDCFSLNYAASMTAPSEMEF